MLDRFTAWAAGVGVRSVQDLTAPHLTRFRDHYRQDGMAAPVRGGKRGAKSTASRRRSPASVNKAFTVTKTFLGWARRRGWTPTLNGDAIRDNLMPVKLPREAIRYLPPDRLRNLLEAALRHDRDRFTLTRAEHDGLQSPGSTPRHQPVAPFLLGVLLTGCRFQEMAGLRWEEVDFHEGAIRLPATRVKTGHARAIQLAESPSMLALLRKLRLRTGGEFVFGMTRDRAETARRRLVRDYEAPEFTWHDLRRTCGTVLTCAPGIYGGASAFLSAKRLGHSVQIAERSYVGVLTGLPATTKTLEASAGVEDLAKQIVAAAGGVVEGTAHAG